MTEAGSLLLVEATGGGDADWRIGELLPRRRRDAAQPIDPLEPQFTRPVSLAKYAQDIVDTAKEPVAVVIGVGVAAGLAAGIAECAAAADTAPRLILVDPVRAQVVRERDEGVRPEFPPGRDRAWSRFLAASRRAEPAKQHGRLFVLSDTVSVDLSGIVTHRRMEIYQCGFPQSAQTDPATRDSVARVLDMLV